MKIRSVFINIFLFVFTITLFLPRTYALDEANSSDSLIDNPKFILSSYSSEVEKGKNFNIGVQVASNECQNISVFRIKIHFDRSVVSFVNVSPKGELNSKEISYSLIDDTVTVIYLTSEFGFWTDLFNPLDVFDITFYANKDINDSEALFSAEIDGVSDYDLNELNFDSPDNVSVSIVDHVRPDCTLSSLVPSEGILYPDFDPHIFDYSLDVPYDVSKVEFEVETSSDKAKIKVNRKSLSKAGTSTDIKIAVYHPNSKYKIIYTVKVNRDSKPMKDSTSSKKSSSSSSKGKASGSSSSKNKNSNKSSSSNSDKQSNSNNNSDNNSNSDDDETVNTMANNTYNPGESSKVIYVKENGFNLYLAGVCSMSVLILIFYFIKNIYKSNKALKL